MGKNTIMFKFEYMLFMTFTSQYINSVLNLPKEVLEHVLYLFFKAANFDFFKKTITKNLECVGVNVHISFSAYKNAFKSF